MHNLFRLFDRLRPLLTLLAFAGMVFYQYRIMTEISGSGLPHLPGSLGMNMAWAFMAGFLVIHFLDVRWPGDWRPDKWRHSLPASRTYLLSMIVGIMTSVLLAIMYPRASEVVTSLVWISDWLIFLWIVWVYPFTSLWLSMVSLSILQYFSVLRLNRVGADKLFEPTWLPYALVIVFVGLLMSLISYLLRKASVLHDRYRNATLAWVIIMILWAPMLWLHLVIWPSLAYFWSIMSLLVCVMVIGTALEFGRQHLRIVD